MSILSEEALRCHEPGAHVTSCPGGCELWAAWSRAPLHLPGVSQWPPLRLSRRQTYPLHSFFVLLSNAIFLQHKPAQAIPSPKVNIRFVVQQPDKIQILSKAYTFFPSWIKFPNYHWNVRSKRAGILSLLLTALSLTQRPGLAHSRCLIST